MLGMGGGIDRIEKQNQVAQKIAEGLRDLLEQVIGTGEAQSLLKGEGTPTRVVALVEVCGYTFSLLASAIPACRCLTERQKSIALLAAEGLPNKRIAKRLGITPGTVASHLERIFRKLEVNSRVTLATTVAFLK